jgi:hypothetical protein
MRRVLARSWVTLVVATVAASTGGPAAAKLPPVDVSAPSIALVGTRVSVEMWFVDRDGLPLPGSETASWVPAQVGGWMWAYPARRGRPDPTHPGIRIPLVWRDGRYRGSFVPDLDGPWLVVPFGENHRMPDPFGPARPMTVLVRPIVGSTDVATDATYGGPRWSVGGLAIAGTLGSLLAIGRRLRAR